MERFPGVWTTRRPFIGTGTRGRAALPRRLVAADREYVLLRAPGGGRPDLVPPGSFVAQGASLFVTTAGDAAPAEATLWEYVDLGRQDGDRRRVALEGFAGDGFVLVPGFPVRIECATEVASNLLFTSSAHGPPEGGEEGCLLEVQQDGETVYEAVLELSAQALARAHRVELPFRAGRHALSFRLSGAPAVSTILAPVVAARADTASAAKAPSVMLFIADTFRADNLESYGGEPCIAPNLARLAAEGRVFLGTTAAASWTLPSHATLFSGLTPHAVGVVAPRDALADEVSTLAEVLSASGYRTAAITDDAYVSAEFGFAQGFEYFDARRRGPGETVQAVADFLSLEDGRPFFLVVHSYRAHHPYAVSPETRDSIGARIGLPPAADEPEYAALPQSIPGWSAGFVSSPELRRRMSGYEALYRGASADLDRLFGEVRETLRARARSAEALIVFTSDHGEAFWEHGIAEHGNGVWGEHLAIPLIVAGPRIEAGTSRIPAGLIDLPRTVCALVGIEPDPRWGGVDLFAAPDDRAVLAFQCDMRGGPSSFVLLTRGKKLVFSEEHPAELEAAFDLVEDPGERHNRATEAWAIALATANRVVIRDAFQRKVETVEATPDEAALRDLEALGYGGK
jgi:arylsulfatase A-like enzyme